jgi:hypothetical protein
MATVAAVRPAGPRSRRRIVIDSRMIIVVPRRIICEIIRLDCLIIARHKRFGAAA